MALMQMRLLQRSTLFSHLSKKNSKKGCGAVLTLFPCNRSLYLEKRNSEKKEQALLAAPAEMARLPAGETVAIEAKEETALAEASAEPQTDSTIVIDEESTV